MFFLFLVTLVLQYLIAPHKYKWNTILYILHEKLKQFNSNKYYNNTLLYYYNPTPPLTLFFHPAVYVCAILTMKPCPNTYTVDISASLT